MARFRSFLFPNSIVDAQSVTLDARESHHLARVLRAKVGDSVEVLDGKGNLVEYLSKKLNTNISLMLKYKEYIETVVYLPKN